MEKNNLINKNQHGFRTNRSCSTQILSHINYILSNAVDKNEIDCVYIDYEKAFDKIDHKILIQKLHQLQIPSKYINWITNFLQDRTQIVYVNETFSYPVKVLSGVPQGSVLGPILFVIYINDLPNFLNNCNILTFADDTKIVSKINCTQDHINLQENLDNLINWTAINNMRLNKTKFEFITHNFGAENKNLKFLKELPFFEEFRLYYSSEKNVISYSPVVRDLGIYIDAEINWDYHRNKIYKKAKQLCGWILNTFFTRNKNIMRTLFVSLVRPIIEYGCEIWSPYKIKDILLLESIQRNFTSKITSLKYINYTERMKELRLTSLQRRREKLKSFIHEK